VIPSIPRISHPAGEDEQTLCERQGQVTGRQPATVEAGRLGLACVEPELFEEPRQLNEREHVGLGDGAAHRRHRLAGAEVLEVGVGRQGCDFSARRAAV